MADKPKQACEICGRVAEGEPVGMVAPPSPGVPAARPRSYRFECTGPHEGRSGHVWFWMVPEQPKK